jgi:hypothetical protein
MEKALETVRMNLQELWLPVVLTVCAVLLFVLGRFDVIVFETGLFKSVAIQVLLLVLILLGIWIFDYRKIRLNGYLMLLVGLIVVGSIRTIWWDYYFIEIFIASLYYVFSDREFSKRFQWRRLYSLAAIAIVGFNLAYMFYFKVMTDRAELKDMVFEKLLRKGTVEVDEISNANFGFLAWKLFDYARAHEDPKDPDATRFQAYVRAGKVVLDDRTPWKRKFKFELSADDQVLEEGSYSIGFSLEKYRVVRFSADSTISILPKKTLLPINKKEFRLKRYPLSNEEWRQLVEGD